MSRDRPGRRIRADRSLERQARGAPINPQLPVYDLTTLADRRSLALSQDRMMAALSAALGLMTLLLAAVHWLVVRETLVLVLIGGTIGIPLSLTGARVLKSMR